MHFLDLVACDRGLSRRCSSLGADCGLMGGGGGLTSVCVVSSQKVKVRPGRVWSKGTILTYLQVTWEDHPCLLLGRAAHSDLVPRRTVGKRGKE